MMTRKHNIIKIFFFVLAVTVLAVMILTGCSASDNGEDYIDNTTTEYNTGDIDYNEADETVSDEKDETTTTEKDETTTVKRDETTTVKKDETTTEKKDEAETAEKDEPATVNKDKNYNKLLNQLNAKLNSRKFPKRINKLIIKIFDMLWNNYPDWKKGYRDMPSKSEYIKANLIDSIDNISEIICYDAKSDEGKELLEEGAPAGLTYDDLSIEMILDDDESDIENLYHEIIHCKQKNIAFEDSYYEGCEDIQDLIVEGGATFHMKFLDNINSDKMGSWSVLTTDGSKELDYGKADCIGYLFHMNLYEKLVYLAGYDTIDKVERGVKPLSSIKSAIAKRYDKKSAEKFFKLLSETFVAYNENFQDDKTYNLCIELENMFIDFMEHDINNIDKNDSQQVKQYKNIVRIYKKKNIPVYYKNGFTEIVPEEINIRKIDSALKKKSAK